LSSQDRIGRTPGVCGGKACIAGHPVRVLDVVLTGESRVRSAGWPFDLRIAGIPRQTRKVTLCPVLSGLLRGTPGRGIANPLAG
jgi:hypothetical protein